MHFNYLFSHHQHGYIQIRRIVKDEEVCYSHCEDTFSLAVQQAACFKGCLSEGCSASTLQVSLVTIQQFHFCRQNENSLIFHVEWCTIDQTSTLNRCIWTEAKENLSWKLYPWHLYCVIHDSIFYRHMYKWRSLIVIESSMVSARACILYVL